MDTTAFTLSQENKLPIIVFDMNTKDNLINVCKWKKDRYKSRFIKNIDMEEMDFIVGTAKEGMNQALEHLEKEMLNLRAGKANPIMLSSVKS